MKGDVGAVATLLNTVARWVMSEDGYAQWQRKRELRRLKEVADAELEKFGTPDWDQAAYLRAVDELIRLSYKP